MERGFQGQITDVLSELVHRNAYHVALVCTEEGLLVASSDDQPESDELAGITSLFDDIVVRAERDLGVQRVDEVTLLDPGRGRLVIRPLGGDDLRFFLVVRVPTTATWRRNTNVACRTLGAMLAPSETP